HASRQNVGRLGHSRGAGVLLGLLGSDGFWRLRNDANGGDDEQRIAQRQHAKEERIVGFSPRGREIGGEDRILEGGEDADRQPQQVDLIDNGDEGQNPEQVLRAQHFAGDKDDAQRREYRLGQPQRASRSAPVNPEQSQNQRNQRSQSQRRIQRA